MVKNSVYMLTDHDSVFETHYPENYPDAKRITKKEGEKLFKEQTRKELLKIVKPGTRVYCILRSCARSGMSRSISLFVCHKNDLINITGMAATVINHRTDKNGGIVIGGCGMDMGFHLVYTLGQKLWPNGTKKPHGTRNGQPDESGGYALKQHWL